MNQTMQTTPGSLSHPDRVGCSSETNLSEAEILAWLMLIRDRRWSSAQKLELLKKFGSPLELQAQSLAALRGALSKPWQRKTSDIQKHMVKADLEWLQDPAHRLIPYGDAAYPELLLEIPDPPLALFCKGRYELLNDPAIAMVGSRSPTPGGKKITTDIASDLARSGLTVVSGMALGIDAAAHRGALDVGGSTIAVMGCGLDSVYPAQHRHLFEQIAETGCLISEFPLGVGVSRYTFPKRNRLVSGLSLGTIVVEAATKSGTLITARLAMEQNRAVMAVPGSPLSRQYQGSHALLKQGAALVTSASDVLLELDLPLREALNRCAENPSSVSSKAPEETLLGCIYHQPTSVDSIISASGLTAAEVSSMLLTLELQGSVCRTRDGGYVKVVAD